MTTSQNSWHHNGHSLFCLNIFSKAGKTNRLFQAGIRAVGWDDTRNRQSTPGSDYFELRLKKLRQFAGLQERLKNPYGDIDSSVPELRDTSHHASYHAS